MHSNRYTFLFAAGISLITAVLLSLASSGLKPFQDANIELDKKTSVLRSVLIQTTDRDSIEYIYDTRIEEVVIDSKGEVIPNLTTDHVVLKDELDKPGKERTLPLYVYSAPDGSKKYIIPMLGKGLWGPIWGYMSLEEDFNTIYGANFDHKGETPGLGAEISERPFQEQFEGKKILGTDDRFVSVHVVKSSMKVPYGDEHRVDAISGGTITSVGTDQMISNAIEPYLAYFSKLKKQG